ncbi:MAG: ATP-grasp domain-containing protein [Ruminococcus sp.]|nr:ATP-grasp domain-containing protein [Ruminococcus sp.]
MKKILMLGGSHFQTVSIKKAKEMGLYVITCDYLPDNPGHKFADEYHNVSTTDKEAVLELAKKLKVDGVVCYASDPAAPTQAYVSEKLGLCSNPYNSVEILSNKDKFRKFLNENGFCTPKAMGFNSASEAEKRLLEFKLPVMIKPVDSSGSKGVSVLDDPDKLSEQAEHALGYSRSKRFIIEEYVEKYGYQIAGDGFSVNGKLVFRCFANEHFDTSSENRFVPIGESWPYNMPRSVHEKIHAAVQRAFDLLKLGTGAYNFDIRIDKDENVYLMEIGARNGGNLIPQVVKYATGVDMIEYTIKAALGEDCSDLKQTDPTGFWSCYMVHSDAPGILKSVTLDREFEKNNLVEYEMLSAPVETVPAFTGSNGTLGTMILKYDSMEEMLYKMDHMKEFVKVEVG